MSVFFAMVDARSGCRPAFFLTRQSAPEGAVEISEKRHGELLEALAAGRTLVADARGRPVIDRRTRPDKAALRAAHHAAIRKEAARRIRKISPEWRQMNDLRSPSEAGAIRFARIDAIRAASDAIESLSSGLPATDLASISIATHALWPEFD